MGRRGFAFPPSTCQTETLGREFITSYMEDCGNSSQFEVQITGYFAFTSVSVSISNYPFDGGRFEEKIVVNQGEVVRVRLPESVGIKGVTKFSKVVLVKADKDISVVSVSNKHVSPETTVLYPVSSLGNEHYIVTPSTDSFDSYPEFSVMTYEDRNSVKVHVKGKLRFERNVYSTGTKLEIKLLAFQGYQLQGIANVSGTRIISEKPVAVLVGQVCFCNNTKCNHVFEQLLPVCSWGTTYIIPPLPWQEVDERVYITASQSTTVLYQLGEQQETVTLAGGSVLQLPVKPSIPVYISANVGIQVVFYSVGTAIPNSSHAFLMNVPDVASYCRMYSINAQEGFENFALMVANTPETGAIILDNQPLRDVVWNRVPGTEFVWGMHTLGPVIRSHAVEHPSSPFALLSVGTAAMDSYGIPGSCRKNVTFKYQTETLQIKEQLQMCKDVFLQGSNSEFCSFMNSTLVNLETMCAQDRAVSLQEVARPFGSFLNSSALSAGGNESKREVASTVTFLLQSVELAALTAALKSPEMKNQTVTTESMAIKTLLIPAADSCDEVFSLRAQEETMDIQCNTVTRAPTEGTCQTETLGREFITSYMADFGNSSQFEVQITGYFAFTSVSVSISNYPFDGGRFEEKIMVNQGEMVWVRLPESVGIKGSTKFSKVVLVKADKDISVVSVSNKHVSPETTVLYPVSSLGKEHYIVTPSTESLDSYPEFSVMTYQEPNSVEVHVKGKLHYLTQFYSTGTKLEIKLLAFQGIQLQGIADLSGTRIVSEKPVAVLVGQVCFCNNTKCNHVFEQLLPVCSWGTTYIIPPLPWQEVDERVYITASQSTTVLYQLGEQPETVTLAGGSVLQRPVKPSIPVYISANVGIQVLFYSVGTAIPNSSHAFLMNVPDVASYCRMYSINAQEGF
ncbi:avidin-like [Platysternon megacephalum]|uniref:Avidin-like n=1 Tax=Platysternon megacephalum TaxID=55544 RepID=A0A4D9DMS8_9SAUR|nr:avidin-like [Platysternon megacephalum]